MLSRKTIYAICANAHFAQAKSAPTKKLTNGVQTGTSKRVSVDLRSTVGVYHQPHTIHLYGALEYVQWCKRTPLNVNKVYVQDYPSTTSNTSIEP